MDLDPVEIDIECPRCSFYNVATIQQIRLNDVLICRGCKSNLQLIDHMASVTNARKRIMKAIGDLGKSLGKITLRI
jgi:hypothetical protein